jgi:hypothetical protein
MANPSAIRIGQGSTTTLQRIERYRVDWTVPALSSGGSATSTLSVANLSTSDVMVFQPHRPINSTVEGVQALPRCTLAGELVLVQSNNSISTLSGSTASGTLLVFGF